MKPTTQSTISAAQLAANQTNSQHSTGPVTDAGKEKVRFNAVKHGVCSQAILLPHEDKDAFLALGASLAKIWEPASEDEKMKVTELHECYWRLDRIRKAESNLLALAIHEQSGQFADVADPALRRAFSEAVAWRANARQFNLFRRHENALLKEKNNLEEQLKRTRQERRGPDQKLSAEAGEAAVQWLEQIADQLTGNGFVSHNAPASTNRSPLPTATLAELTGSRR